MISDVAPATDRLLATVEALPDREWAGPSECAGWSRSHVIAHVALNAEGLARVLRGIATGEPATMYDSNAARDADIDDLAAAAPAAVRRRTAAACREFAAAATATGPIPPGTTFDRTPAGQVMPARAIPTLRLREVEIHHADLRAGYGFDDWPPATALAFLEWSAARHGGPGFHADADGRRVTFGSPAPDAPTVTGPVAALAWWATGRDPGPVLSSSDGTLPTINR